VTFGLFQDDGGLPHSKHSSSQLYSFQYLPRRLNEGFYLVITRPAVRCKKCGASIEVPHPSLAAKGVWPGKTWGRNFLCLSSKRDVQWLEIEVPLQAVPPEDPVIGCLEIRCAHEGCQFPIMVVLATHGGTATFGPALDISGRALQSRPRPPSTPYTS
jgi:hypothetical protein